MSILHVSVPAIVAQVARIAFSLGTSSLHDIPPRKQVPPSTYASAISFSAGAAPVHSAVSTNEAPTPHSIAARLLASAAELPDRGSQRGVGE